jgi:hypothetical protein
MSPCTQVTTTHDSLGHACFNSKQLTCICGNTTMQSIPLLQRTVGVGNMQSNVLHACLPQATTHLGDVVCLACASCHREWLLGVAHEQDERGVHAQGLGDVALEHLHGHEGVIGQLLTMCLDHLLLLLNGCVPGPVYTADQRHTGKLVSWGALAAFAA